MLRRMGSNENLDTELNLVPIIDCFVMLICFLLFTAAFTQLVYLETKITQNTIAAMTQSRNEIDKFHLVVTLRQDGYAIKLQGSEIGSKNSSIPKVNSDYDYATLHDHLIALKTEFPDRYSIDIAVDAPAGNLIKYEYVLKTIDTVRHLTDKEFSQLRVAGKRTQKIGLSDSELALNVDQKIDRLAESVTSNKVAANADLKALFPDIALTGIY